MTVMLKLWFDVELQAMNRSRLRAAVGLLTGHTNLRAHLYKLVHTERQECRLCGYEKEDSVHVVCDCPVLACKRYRIFGCMLLKPEDLENVRVSSLLSLHTGTHHLQILDITATRT
jgi:hypothetical protein